jgi:hypothetical protein
MTTNDRLPHSLTCEFRKTWVQTYVSRGEDGQIIAFEFRCGSHGANFWLAVPLDAAPAAEPEAVRALVSAADNLLSLKDSKELVKELAFMTKRQQGDRVREFNTIVDDARQRLSDALARYRQQVPS